LAWLLPLVVAFAGPDKTVRTFRLPAGPASETLKQFAEQAQREILFPSEPVADVYTPRVFGDYPPREALARLLTGTRLRALESADTGGFVISPAAAQPIGATDAPVPTNPMKTKSTLAAVAGWFALGAATVMPAQTPASAPKSIEDPLELSPFIVNTDRDTGFAASSSLAGGRLATDLRDTPAAYSVITREFIDALGITDLMQATDWATSASFNPSTGTNNFFTFSTQYVTRGVTVPAGTQQRNFFPQYGENDTFDIERFDFGRGPNSILFGNGTLGGVSSSTTKRARTDRAFKTVQFNAGSWSTYRTTVDVNQPINNQVALRTALVWGDGNGWRQKDFDKRKGAFLTTTFKPFRQTEIRVEGEYLEIKKQVGMTTLNDQLSGWNGTLTYATPVALRNASTAELNAATAAGVNRRAANYYVFDPYNGVSAIANLQGEPMTRAGGSTATTPIAGFTYGASGGGTYNTAGATFRNNFAIPANRFANAEANSAFRVPGDEFTMSPDAPLLASRFKNVQATLDQRFGDFYFQAAADVSRSANFVNGEQNRGTEDAYIDINRVLPDGTPNKHYLQAYGDGSYFRGYRNYDWNNLRAAAAYSKTTDFGRFTVNAMGGSNENHYTIAYRWLSMAQGTDQSLWIQPAQTIRVRRYWNETSRPITDLSLNSINYLNPGSASVQIQPRWVIDSTRDTETINDSRYQYALASLNAKFWKDRLVLLAAVRGDEYQASSMTQVNRGDYPANADPTQPIFRPAAPSDWATLSYVPKDAAGRATGPARLATTRPRTSNLRQPQYANDRFQDDYQSPDLNGRQTTKSAGTVFHVTKWLSPFVNYAETFNVQRAYSVRIDGTILPPTVAKGTDYGLRLDLFGDRLNLNLIYFENQEVNRGSALNGVPINPLYNATPQGSTVAFNKRGQNLLPQYYDIRTLSSSGFEFEATANLAKGFRLTANLSLPKVYEEDANSDTRKYIDANGEIFRQIAQDANVVIDPTTNIASVDSRVPASVISPDAQAAANAYNTIYEWRNAIVPGKVLDQYQPLAKLFADYTLQSSRLKGLRIGLGARYYGKRIIGNRANDTIRDPANLTRAIDDPNRTAYTLVYTPKAQTTVVGTFGYSWKLRGQPLQAQLVINNLLNQRSVTYVGTALRPRDGDYTSPAREAVPESYSLRLMQPINYTLSLTLKL
jgi:outer membrane receptor protein involved in Fe transport